MIHLSLLLEMLRSDFISAHSTYHISSGIRFSKPDISHLCDVFDDLSLFDVPIRNGMTFEQIDQPIYPMHRGSKAKTKLAFNDTEMLLTVWFSRSKNKMFHQLCLCSCALV